MGTWIYYVVMIIVSLLSYALRPSPAKPKAATLEEFELPTMEEGAPQCVIFGERCKKDWEVLWYGDLRTTSIKSGGGK
jgi:hypothetical protein